MCCSLCKYDPADVPTNCRYVAIDQSCIGASSADETDVLDTWFSSALWPHSTLGWPEQTEELKYYYPTNVLITSRDIITLWVARMVLTGLHNVGEVPFHEVFIHPKILDGYGEGMSKSKGNGVDPIDVIEKFGADALRFGLAYLTTETQDVRMPVEFECPHCQKLIEQTRENRTRPTIKCKHCQQAVFDAMGRKARRQGTAARGGGQRAVRVGPQLLQQAVERLAVRADEPRRFRSRPGGRRRAFGRGFVDPEPAGDRDRTSDRRPGRISLCRRRPRALRLRLGRVLQFLRRDGQGPAAGQGDSPHLPERPEGAAHKWDCPLCHAQPAVAQRVWPTRSTRSCGSCTR